jgi:hypothetical protein
LVEEKWQSTKLEVKINSKSISNKL